MHIEIEGRNKKYRCTALGVKRTEGLLLAERVMTVSFEEVALERDLECGWNVGRCDGGKKIPGRGRSTSKDSGRVQIP